MGVAVNTGGGLGGGQYWVGKTSQIRAVGAQVNFTGRVESFTVGGQVLISKGTHERLSEKLDVRQILEVEMRGARKLKMLQRRQNVAGLMALT